MKRYKLIYALTIIGFLQISCNDYLELLPPQDLVQNEYWKTKEDVQAVLMGAYSQASKLSDEMFFMGEIRADMVRINSSRWDYANAKDSKITPEDRFTKWADYYSVINLWNYVLDFAPDVKKYDETFKDYMLKGYESEAYFLRSLMYFNLVKIFNKVPLVLRSSKSDNEDFYLPQSDENTILLHLLNDLKIAQKQTTGSYQDVQNNKGRATKAAIHALISDIYLWKASGETGAEASNDYDSCIVYCDKILNDNRLVLLPGQLWFSNFYPGNSLESIFEFQFDAANGQPNEMFALTFQSNFPYYPSLKAEELLTDVGINTEVWRIATVTNYPYKIWKYAGASSNQRTARISTEQSSANFIVYRLPDIMLMKAEALIFSNRAAEAFSLINAVRDRAFLPAAGQPSSIIEQENILLDERAKEFAFEGKRWWDLMRMGRRDNFARKKDFVEIIISEVSAKDRLVLANRLLDPNGWYWPVNLQELEVNPNLVQNPYYADYKKK